MSQERTKGVNMKERMLSACAGSVLTSLFLTPMDVVRIRLQQQEMLPECSCSDDMKKAVVVNNQQKVQQGVAKIFWQDACFQDLQCKNSTMRFNSTWEALAKIAEYEGITTLWRGLSITLLMAVPANVVYFSGYEAFRDWSPLREKYDMLNPLVCGAVARMFAATAIAPMELTKTRFQSIPRDSKNTTAGMMFRDLIKEIRSEIATNGYKVLFKGLNITLWRDVPFSAIYWGSYEFYKKSNWINFKMEGVSSNWDHFINGFIGGSLSGTLAALVTHPFDVGKTRMQIALDIQAPKKNTLVSQSNESSKASKNMFKYLYNIINVEGIGALYSGLVPRMLKIAPSCAIMLSTYELSKKFFTS